MFLIIVWSDLVVVLDSLESFGFAARPPTRFPLRLRREFLSALDSVNADVFVGRFLTPSFFGTTLPLFPFDSGAIGFIFPASF